MHMGKKSNKLVMDYCIGEKVLETTHCEKYLGLYISDDLTWKKHIDHVISDSSQKLGMINRLFYHCSSDVKTTLYNHLVRSRLEYCCTVWDPYQVGQVKAIEKVQKKAASIVEGFKAEKYGQAMHDLNWLSLHKRRQYYRNVMCFKICNAFIDIPFEDYFKVKANDRDLRCAHNHQLSPKFARTEACKHSFFFQTIEEWNKLPPQIVIHESVNSFKNGLLEYLTGENTCTTNCEICEVL